MRFLLTLSLLCWLGISQAEGLRVLIQQSPLAGSQYYALGELRAEMRLGDTLTLIREPENRHDRRAIRVEWRGHKLGYVPRAENRAAARALDTGERLEARVTGLRDDPDPWRRIEFSVHLIL